MVDASLAKPSPGPPPSILLAAHDDATAALVKHRLERDGLTVVRCHEGGSVLEAAVAASADLLLLDVQLPGVDGFELLRRLRADDAFRDHPVVMLAWPGNERDAVRAFALGADDYVVKPFSPVELAARIRRLLERSGRGRP